MKNSKEKSIKAINAIENTLKNLDINYHKPLIDLLNEYNNKLNTQDNHVPLITSLVNKISWCILENNLKVPPEVSELIGTLNSLQTRFMVCKF
ncbi:bacteriocin immunity protein [Clostridium uliginosum]|uniref:Enterocin A Immunity n=1 Tax=Clostridium uliginosum TaxID=119641 RepID=A0A1I1IVC6_9CLOT|nr:bacteriocin immunity protein [Clostridium uliginosum]SFC37180.1 Enterocin A Immunity [Clostridium uliginosum]